MPRYSLIAALAVCCVWVPSPGAAMAGDAAAPSASQEPSTPGRVKAAGADTKNEADRKAELAAAPADEKRVAVGPATVAQVEKMTCRTVVATGSRVRTRKVCSTPSSEEGSQSVLRQQQDRAAISSSIILNSGT